MSTIEETVKNLPCEDGVKMDWNCPTNEFYHAKQEEQNNYDGAYFSTTFAQARQKLDYSYHKNPKMFRQEFQDGILKNILASTSKNLDTTSPQEEKLDGGKGMANNQKQNPWIVFTAGCMGVGKSYALSQLFQKDLFPLDMFVAIDPDKIKSELPEMAGYLAHDPESAATKVHRESTQMSDVLFEHALANQEDILVDGSLRDVEWYKILFQRLRSEFPMYRLAILHVSADPDIVRLRVKKRAEYTGRDVPQELLEDSMTQVPISVNTLGPLADVTCEISNNDSQPIDLVKMNFYYHSDQSSSSQQEPNLDWATFAKIWTLDSETAEPEQQQEPMICSLLKCSVNTEQMKIAKDIWGKAYPNMCTSCLLSADAHGSCGICTHGEHYCKCPVCTPNAVRLFKAKAQLVAS